MCSLVLLLKISLQAHKHSVTIKAPWHVVVSFVNKTPHIALTIITSSTNQSSCSSLAFEFLRYVGSWIYHLRVWPPKSNQFILSTSERLGQICRELLRNHVQAQRTIWRFRQSLVLQESNLWQVQLISLMDTKSTETENTDMKTDNFKETNLNSIFFSEQVF